MTESTGQAGVKATSDMIDAGVVILEELGETVASFVLVQRIYSAMAERDPAYTPAAPALLSPAWGLKDNCLIDERVRSRV